MTKDEALDAWIAEQMTSRGFLRHDDKTGHWRSAGWSGHDLEIRARTIRRWLRPYWFEDDVESVRKKFAGEIDALIAKAVSA